MCCCDKPTVNGELGYKWQPNDAPGIRKPAQPPLVDGDVLLYDEPGRCGGLDSHSHHFRIVKHGCGTVSLLVRHGGGDERIRLFPHRDLPKLLGALDSNARYWMLATIHSAHRDGASEAQAMEAMKWKSAAADKRIKTRKYPSRGYVKVWIEPEVKAAPDSAPENLVQNPETAPEPKPDTLQDHDAHCTQLFRELDALKAAGKESSEPGSEYMTKLYELRDATTNRLSGVL